VTLSDFPTVFSHATTPSTLGTLTDTTGGIVTATRLNSPLPSISQQDTNGVIDLLELIQRKS
jgi:hypothetical protein